MAFSPQATAHDLFLVVLAFAVFWFAIFNVLKSIIGSLVHGKPWLVEALDREYERASKKLLVELQITMTKEEAMTWTLNDWPRMQCIYVQHFSGSLMCVPSIFGLGDPNVASLLAMCGILSEMGWELQDAAEMLFVRMFCKNGKTIWPDTIVAIFMVHHSLTMVLGVPMVLYYRHSRSLMWLCFDLQFSGGVALVIGEYTKLLDLSKPQSLLQFKVLNFLALATLLWTRVFHWGYLCVDMYVTWYRDEAWVFLGVGFLLTVGFTMFNMVCCVKPQYNKFLKFLHVSAEYESLPEDVAPKTRRASVVKLDEAVADLLEGDGAVKLADMVEKIFVGKKMSRRCSMPVQSRKRPSLVWIKSMSSVGHEEVKSKYL